MENLKKPNKDEKYSDIVKETLDFQIKNQEYTTNFEDILDM